MKKILPFVTICTVAVSLHAASVGWSIGKTDASYLGSAYQFFIIGQKGVESIDAIKLLLDAGTDVSDKAFGSGTVTSATGGITVQAKSTGLTLDAGSYEAFFVFYDSATVASGESKYVVFSGANGLSKTFAATASTVSFAAGDQSSTVANPANWASFGTATPVDPDPPTPVDPVPEPTTVALLALGLAAVGLKRKVA